jgi:hypothetical protein
MIAKVPQFENPIIIQFTAPEGAAVSYWLDEIDWEDIHIAVDGCPGCGDKSHYLDTKNIAPSRTNPWGLKRRRCPTPGSGTRRFRSSVPLPGRSAKNNGTT